MGKKEKERIQQLYQDHINLIIVKLTCVHGVVLKVINSPEWKALMNLLNPVYKPASANTFHDQHTPHEAVHVCQKQVEVLHQSSNLTLTFNGNSVRKQQCSVYTAHTTTPNQETFCLMVTQAVVMNEKQLCGLRRSYWRYVFHIALRTWLTCSQTICSIVESQ